jgi:hypothetical protein
VVIQRVLICEPLLRGRYLLGLDSLSA